MAAVFNMRRMTVTSTGTGTLSLGVAASGWRAFAASPAIPDGTSVSYRIDDTGGAWELAVGVYTVSGLTLTRGTFRESSTGSVLSVTTAATVTILALAEDLPPGKQTIYIPASAMLPRITNGPSLGSLETATNRVNVSTLDFDPTTQEFAQFQIAMPKSWNEGTVTYDVIWYHPSTTTNFGVVWSLAGVALSDTNALDTAFGTAVQVTDTGGTTNAVYDSPESGAVTIGNTPAENDYVIFQIARVPADGSDTMAVDARLLGIRLFYTTNAGNDA
jgi:hypothetical protein